MYFDSALFVWFFGAVLFLNWSLRRFPMARVLWLLLASYAFYAAWNPKLLSLIVLSTVVDFYVGRRVYEAEDQTSKKRWLITSLVTNLGLLGVFKYGAFVRNSLQSVLDAAGAGAELPLIELVLPVGISFYTFQTLSYTIDIYRGHLKPVRSITHFALFVAFFPQLVAGPIVRARDFLPQLEKMQVATATMQGMGLFLMARGLVKKVAIADVIAVQYVDRVFDNPELYSSLEILVALYGYSVQIYCDFSGYSDVAIGAALVLGFVLPENFRRPFASANLQDHWRRWHITLSTWLRDYLYIPLGGSRNGPVSTYWNLFLTMALGGLWHGAAWTYVLWGSMQGAGLAVVRFMQRRWPREGKMPPWRFALGVFVTFHFTCIGWIFFRSPTVEDSWRMFGLLMEGSTYAPNLRWQVMLPIVLSMGIHWTPRRWIDRWSPIFAASPALVQAFVLAVIAVMLAQLSSGDAPPFIYFQF